ncbi:hypothetical protein P4S83_08635 [Aneurinibacillus thermoaerophilus]|uniref:hypothetical protein n=1 Tax=Aneurinibacillus thermoaerophilus TaxID=143495 RepID=UPI002E21F913|nr:hypothetical protein [Aneurinibacillus thermoaerophilus]MED0763799.1 hypothetical protein [Aneurinibacillus thermoaerophilus]
MRCEEETTDCGAGGAGSCRRNDFRGSGLRIGGKNDAVIVKSVNFRDKPSLSGERIRYLQAGEHVSRRQALLVAFGNFVLLSGPLFFKSRYVWIKMAQTRTRYPNDILNSPFPDVLRLIVPGLC